MGREASCRCRWGAEEAEVKALLETHELIVRGGIRRRVPFADIRDLSLHEDSLVFRVGPDLVALNLGAQAAARWAKAIAEPPNLASKLGISKGKPVKLLGCVEDDALKEALAQTTSEKDAKAELVLLLARTPEEFEDLVTQCGPEISCGIPLWVVYPKGKGKPLSESHVRATLRARGMVDTKVASVSAELTALRFSYRKAETTSGHTHGR
jgi:hypothetical protein